MHLFLPRILLVMLFICPVARAQSTDEQISTLLSVTDIKQEVVQIPDFIAEEASSPELGFNPDQKEMFLQLMGRAYKPDTILETVRSYIQQRYDAEHSSRLLKSLTSPIARRMQGIEQAAMSVNDSELDAYVGQMEFNPPSEDRMALIKQYGEVTGKIDIPLDLIVGVMRGFMGVQATSEGLGEDEIEIAISLMQIDLHEDLQNLFYLKTLYTFRNTPDEDLIAYNQLWESEAGKRFVSISNAGLRKALKKSADRVGELAK
jgi:hypothetical protein